MYGITHALTQVGVSKKGKVGTGLVLVSLCSNMVDFVPCDQVVQRVYWRLVSVSHIQ